jgi:cyclase
VTNRKGILTVAERTLIVARLDPEHTSEVARLFAESDAGELPDLIGATRRTLYSFHGLYFHLVEADKPVGPGLREVRNRPIFTGLNDALAEFVRPYSADWREPRDAMATPFYHWSKGDK